MILIFRIYTADMTTQYKNSKINALQIIRAFAFMAIFFYHCSLTALGSWGVSVFFILSGFVLTYSHYDRSLQLSCDPVSAFRFAAGKMARLYPLHLFMMVLSMHYDRLLTFTEHGITHFIARLTADIFLMQSWIPLSDYYYSFNVLSWYLSDMLFLYFLFPFILALLHHCTDKKQIIQILLSAFLLQLLSGWMMRGSHFFAASAYPFIHWFTYVFPLFRAGDFLIGCCLGCLFLQRDNSKAATGLYTVFEALALFQIPAFMLFEKLYIAHHGTSWWSEGILFLPFTAFLIYVFACSQGRISQKLSSCRPLLFIAEISPYCYLIHFVAFREIFHYVSQAMPRTSALCITVFLVALISITGSLLYQQLLIWQKRQYY